MKDALPGFMPLAARFGVSEAAIITTLYESECIAVKGKARMWLNLSLGDWAAAIGFVSKTTLYRALGRLIAAGVVILSEAAGVRCYAVVSEEVELQDVPKAALSTTSFQNETAVAVEHAVPISETIPLCFEPASFQNETAPIKSINTISQTLSSGDVPSPDSPIKSIPYTESLFRSDCKFSEEIQSRRDLHFCLDFSKNEAGDLKMPSRRTENVLTGLENPTAQPKRKRKALGAKSSIQEVLGRKPGSEEWAEEYVEECWNQFRRAYPSRGSGKSVAASKARARFIEIVYGVVYPGGIDPADLVKAITFQVQALKKARDKSLGTGWFPMMASWLNDAVFEEMLEEIEAGKPRGSSLDATEYIAEKTAGSRAILEKMMEAEFGND